MKIGYNYSVPTMLHKEENEEDVLFEDKHFTSVGVVIFVVTNQLFSTDIGRFQTPKLSA